MVESMSVSISQENCQVKFQTMSWCQDTRRYVDWHLPCQIKFPNGCQSQCQKKNKSNVRLFVRVYVWMYVRRCVTWKLRRAIVRIHIRMYVTHEICQIKCKSKCQSWCHFFAWTNVKTNVRLHVKLQFEEYGSHAEEKRPNNTINHDIVNLARNYPSKVGDDE